MIKIKEINVARKSCVIKLKNAVFEEVHTNITVDVIKSGDGTRKTRGHTSQFGVWTIIGNTAVNVFDMGILSTA